MRDQIVVFTVKVLRFVPFSVHTSHSSPSTLSIVHCSTVTTKKLEGTGFLLNEIDSFEPEL